MRSIQCIVDHSPKSNLTMRRMSRFAWRVETTLWKQQKFLDDSFPFPWTPLFLPCPIKTPCQCWCSDKHKGLVSNRQLCSRSLQNFIFKCLICHMFSWPAWPWPETKLLDTYQTFALIWTPILACLKNLFWVLFIRDWWKRGPGEGEGVISELLC